MSPSSWEDTLHDVEDDNGLILNGNYIPHELLQNILTLCDFDSFKSVALTCRKWKIITTQRSFWKATYESRGLDWSIIPEECKTKKNAWCLLFVALRRNGFKQNLVENGSGECGLLHWTSRNEQRGFVCLESPPIGCESLDDEPNMCFATSFMPSEFEQSISIGVHVELFRLMLPCEVRFSIMVAARFDCGGSGIFQGIVECERLPGESLAHQPLEGIPFYLDAGETSWNKLTCAALFGADNDVIYSTPNFRIYIEAKDNRFWAGNYGPKISRITAEVKLLTPDELANPDPGYLRTRICPEDFIPDD